MILEIQRKLYRTKVQQFMDRLEQRILSDHIFLEGRFARSKDPVPFQKRLDLEYQAITEGAEWGQTWDSAWFHLVGKIPEHWANDEVVAHLDFNGEALVFSQEGVPLQGLTNGSVLGRITRHNFRLAAPVLKNPQIELWVEAAANSIMGIHRPRDPERGSDTIEATGNQVASTAATLRSGDTISRHGSYRGIVNRMRLARFKRDLYDFWLDMEVLNGLLDSVPDSSTRFARILEGLVKVTNNFKDAEANAGQCREMLQPLLQKSANASAPTINAVGHAHIDTGWLWPVRETIRKSARTFASQLDLMERYPEYVFGASQPQHYQFVKDHYPELYEKIQEAVAGGRWELQGGMWIEPDCNLISGESMVRQILHGKNFFMDEFGVDVNNCWIPDVFGYSAAMPQILKLGGLDHFLTQKMSWSQFNRFPYSTFRWRGIDGTEVLTHFPPEDTYNSQLQPYDLQKTERNFVEKGVLDEMMCLFGVGDGGGGPTSEMIERGLRQKNLEGVPKVSFGRADRFFERISEKAHELPVWSGELYLELHRGTLTTQARTKRNNRMLEQSLRATEYLLSLGSLKDYPQEELDSLWKILLINQFHDILPGSSIHWVYEVTEREHQDALATCERLRNESVKQLFDQDRDAITLINTLNIAYERLIELPKDWNGGLKDENGNEFPVQQDTNGQLTALLTLAPQEIKTLRLSNAAPQANKVDSLILENQFVSYEFNEHAQLVVAKDLETGDSILADGEVGNLLTLYEDRPHNWDAWEIDVSYEDMAVETAKGQTWQSLGAGPVHQSLLFQLKIGNSKIDQKISLRANSKALEFETKVDWQECHRMLRTAFPISVQTDSATCDIQYGHLKRPTHRNTTWDMARFEVVAQKYVDLSDQQRGVALLNDCKYGHKLHDNVIDLHLLRSPTHPDPDADLGTHQFCYVLYPHKNSFQESDVIEQAQQLNQAPLFIHGKPISPLQAPVMVESADVGLEVLKKAEKDNCLVLRVVERRGRKSEAHLRLTDSKLKIKTTDLMEWNDSNDAIGGELKLTLKPFEIKTFKLYSAS